MNYLIIPDVHNRVEWAENLITTFPDRIVIFLGDYFDNYHDTPEIAGRTAEWLRHSLGAGRIHLTGNHDLPYRWRGPRTACPGWHPDKHRAVNAVMTRADWDQLKLCLVLRPKGRRPLLLSHAGITLANLYGANSIQDTAKGGRLGHLRDRSADQHFHEIILQRELLQFWGNSHQGHHWLNQGSRMAHHNVAGPFWLDRQEFNPIAGIDQIMGHTHVTTPERHCMPHAAAPVSENWFIDGNGKFAMLIDDGAVQPIWANPGWCGKKAN